MNLKRAYKTSKRLGRSSNGLSVGTLKVRLWKNGRYNRPGPVTVARGKVHGGSQAHQCTVLWTGNSIGKRGAGWHCDCSDFLFTFYTHLNDTGQTLIPIELEPSKGTGPRRAIDEPGLCKHLMAFYERLRDDGFTET